MPSVDPLVLLPRPILLGIVEAMRGATDEVLANCRRGRTPPVATTKPRPLECRHTPCPSGYVAKSEWAERKMRTHRCVRCPACGLYAVWVPKPKPARKETPPATGKDVRRGTFKTCACGKVFLPKRRNNTTCSRPCYIKAYLAARKPPPLPLRACEKCAKSFRPHDERNRFCGRRCNDAAAKRRERQRRGVCSYSGCTLSASVDGRCKKHLGMELPPLPAHLPSRTCLVCGRRIMAVGFTRELLVCRGCGGWRKQAELEATTRPEAALA